MDEVPVQVRLVVLERQVAEILTAQRDDSMFRSEVRTFIARQEALSPGYVARIETLEKSVRELETFKAKILGAVAASGLLGGTAGAVAGAILQALAG